MQTTLLFLEHFDQLEGEATVMEVTSENDKQVVILNQSIFYPQGGGQPYDTGRILSPSGKFFVEEVRLQEGIVKHIGKLESGSFKKGGTVRCFVDRERRQLHARIHSAGHLVDKAIDELKLKWIPGKGYHYPNGPYDEYRGSLRGLDKEKIKADIESLCNGYIQKGGTTEVIFMTRNEMKEVCHYTPDFSEEKGKLARIVNHAGYYMPCGGTPVADLSHIKQMTIRKIKQEGSNIRIGYDVIRD